MFGKETVVLGSKIQLYCPELYKGMYTKDDVMKIENWALDSNHLKTINSISGYSNEARIDEKYILLDTIPCEWLKIGEQKKYYKTKKKLIKLLGNKIVVKRHPRDCSVDNDNVKTYEYMDMPFEVICVNSNIEEKVLITIGSTAVLTPKIIFDKEPKVIWLDRLILGELVDNNRMELIERIRKMYRNPERLIIPENIFELKKALKTKKMNKEEGLC